MDLVHRMSDQDISPSGLKIINQADLILHDSSWIAGVDYEDSNNDNDHNHDTNPDGNDSDNDDESAYDRMDRDDIAANMHPNQLEEADNATSNQVEINVEDEINGEDEINNRDHGIDEETKEINEEEQAITTQSGRQVKIPIRFCKTNNDWTQMSSMETKRRK